MQPQGAFFGPGQTSRRCTDKTEGAQLQLLVSGVLVIRIGIMAPSRAAMSVWLTKVIRLAAQARHNERMAKAPDFKLALAHPIKPKGGPGVLLVTLEDAVRFIGLMKPWRQARPYWDHCASGLLKAAKTGKRADIVEATRCLEVALRRDNWL